MSEPTNIEFVFPLERTTSTTHSSGADNDGSRRGSKQQQPDFGDCDDETKTSIQVITNFV
jgi:hypothetical protein